MKIVSLNVWGGKLLNSLLDFVAEESKNTDIFCFQEVLKLESSYDGGSTEERYNLFESLQENLSEFNSYFSPAQDGFDCDKKTDIPVSFGLAIFIRKTLKVESFNSIFIFGEKSSFVDGDFKTFPYNAQFLTFIDEKKEKTTIVNVHGISSWPKIDIPERIRQSLIINEFLNNKKTKEIICGDFNLLPNTESVHLLERDRVNLIKECGILNTRTSTFKDPHVSDYIFVSQDIKVKDFLVSDITISDHLPLILTV
jgi:endonuclease/exonuclease/phosphatase family metal-dependent hydrolase